MGKKVQSEDGAQKGAKRARVSQKDVPAFSLQDALRVPAAIAENYGGDATKPFDVAAAMDMKPQSSRFKMLAGAAIAYGLTSGGHNANEISLTPLANQILRPLEDGADLEGKRTALLKPRIVSEFLSKYDGSPIPKPTIAHNVLEAMGVPRERADEVLSLIIDSADALGLTREIKNTKYINLSAGLAAAMTADASEESSDEDDGCDSGAGAETLETEVTESSQISRVPSAVPQQDDPKRNRVFITHGKNKTFIDPIKKLLSFGNLEAVVAVEKQSASQPVPDKVMTEMRSCGAAIIHVEDELELMDASANKHVVLNPNVLIEIGAAMALYGKKFILLVKQGVDLPSNLQGLYQVRYEGEALDGDATIRLLEAINAMKSES